ncbi:MULTISPECIES: hypothetical protein [unclassified Brenneria]|uniref:hypothetical protein n=1 Tax=unclassified Brenneria TaxID=2634434 RepID=UPI001557BCF6|nr:hypothetical protein [Brenneria sp. hezel4-2-4]MEE3650694.1 hypothetical protein [Brenneria sp. HEZEL_4_2_4]NPD00649.1 hypothetical protein [Brenneria sp. hezel4-2-4]
MKISSPAVFFRKTALTHRIPAHPEQGFAGKKRGNSNDLLQVSDGRQGVYHLMTMLHFHLLSPLLPL